MSIRNRKLIAGMGAWLGCMPAFAQDAPAPSVEEVVVTATRRQQSLQDIPIAITALSGEDIERARVNGFADMQSLVPGLQVNRNNAVLAFTMRGVGSNFRVQGVDTTIALHTDGIYLSNGFAAQAAFFDVERIEAVRGPQGVLYGRNASGGAINVISKRPTQEWSGFASATAGNYEAMDFEGALSGPIVEDKVLFRVGGFSHTRDEGYGTNFTTGHPNDDLAERGAKATLLFRPTETFEALIRADYYWADDHSLGTQALPGSAPGRISNCLVAAPCAPGLTHAETLGGVIASGFDSYANAGAERHMEFWGVSAEMSYEASDQLTIKSLTGYRETKASNQTDNDQTALAAVDPLLTIMSARQFSEELQLNWQTERTFTVLGLYYFEEHRPSLTLLEFPALDFLPPPNYGDVYQDGFVDTSAYAAFGNIDYELTDRLTVGLGARYSEETKKNEGFNAAVFGPLTFSSQEKTWSAFTPRATVNYRLTDDVSVFGSIAQGFKSGQFGVAIPVGAEPEYIWDYEAGLKGAFLEGDLHASASVFYYDFKDLQLQVFRGPTNLIINSPKASSYGIEVALDWQLPAQVRLFADATWMHSEFEGLVSDDPNTGEVNADLSGNRFPYTPDLQVNVGIEKAFTWASAGEGTLRIENQYTSDTYLDILQSRLNAFRPEYHILNASYRHELAGGWSLLVWGKNLGDERVVMAANFSPSTVGWGRLVNYNAPRTYGVTVRLDF